MGDPTVLKIVRRGWWVYDGCADLPVDVVGIAYDFWFSVADADGQLEVDELPLEPDVNGLLYCVRFRRAGETSTPTWPDSGASRDVEAAVRAAAALAPSPIRWEPPAP